MILKVEAMKGRGLRYLRFSLINARTNRVELTRKSANSEKNGRFENEKKKIEKKEKKKERATYLRTEKKQSSFAGK